MVGESKKIHEYIFLNVFKDATNHQNFNNSTHIVGFKHQETSHTFNYFASYCHRDIALENKKRERNNE